METKQKYIDEKIVLLDYYASHSLNALIQKLPFFDAEGKIGEMISAEELHEIKQDIAKSAFNYAQHMIFERDNAIEWIKGNADSLFKNE